MIRYAVVTRVPDPDDGGDAGNMALSIPYVAQGPAGMTVVPATRMHGLEGLTIAWRAPVFVLGEVLMLDETGREYVGRGRYPSKWDVDVEEFESALEALMRAEEVQSVRVTNIAPGVVLVE